MNRRLDIVRNSIENLREVLEEFGGPAYTCNNELCVDLAYGSLLRSIKRTGLWPLLSYKQTWHGSVKKLAQKLKEVHYTTIADDAVINALHVGDRYGYAASLKRTHPCNLYNLRSAILAKFSAVT